MLKSLKIMTSFVSEEISLAFYVKNIGVHLETCLLLFSSILILKKIQLPLLLNIGYSEPRDIFILCTNL